ncbi:MFS transporter [Actinoplanes sp. TFC3]|uniref:MFS transporter n=1 Tax=Actinoplanes sp. TFC3 TaxID=1710355 RepID=UPI0008327B71|nr:MFS transporter [Actinoplanes sp. TFC3]
MAADSFRRSQVSIAALFCFLGFQYGTWASRVPQIKDGLALSEAEVGLLLLSTGIGAAVSFPFVSRMMRVYGSRTLAIASCVALVVVLPALALAPSFAVALGVLFCDGIAVACLNVSMNAQGAALEARYSRTTMAKLHAVFSGGTLLSALLASVVVSLSPGLALHFTVGAVLLVLLIVAARAALLVHETAPEAPKGRLSLPSRVTAWLGLAMVFGTVTEGAMNDWSALYLSDIAHAAAGLTPLGIAVVSGMMVLARLFADGWRARWGDERVVVGGALLAGAGLAGALVAGGVVPALLGFACVGLGMAAITPCLYVAAANQGPDALTLVAAMGTTGLLAGPPVIGFIANGSSLVWGMAAVAVSALLVAVCVVQVRDRLSRPAVFGRTPGS